MQSTVRRLIPIVVLFILVSASYFAALQNEYVWDDKLFFLDRDWFGSFQSAIDASLRPVFVNSQYFRPLPMFSFYLDGLILGRSPFVSHAFNILIHLTCTILVYVLASNLLNRQDQNEKSKTYQKVLALFCAAVFAVTPLNTEAVVWVSGRFDLMATAFLLMMLLSEIKIKSEINRAIVVGIFFFLAALSKEVAVAAPILVVAIQIMRDGLLKGPISTLSSRYLQLKNHYSMLSLLSFGILYLIIRINFVTSSSAADEAKSITQILTTPIIALGKYAILSITHIQNISPTYSFVWATDPLFPKYAASLFFGILILIALVYTLYKRHIIGLAILCWLALLFPVLHILPVTIGANLVHLRFLYAPMAIILSILPLAIPTFHVTRTAKAILIIICVISLFTMTLVTASITKVWKNDLTLWTWGNTNDPKSTDSRSNLVKAYLDFGMNAEAQAIFKELVASKTAIDVSTMANMGTLYLRQREFRQAAELLEIAKGVKIENNILKSTMTNNLAVAYAGIPNPELANLNFMEALQADPTNIQAIGNVMGYCRMAGRSISPINKNSLAYKKAVAVSLAIEISTPSVTPNQAAQICNEQLLKTTTFSINMISR